MFTTRTDDRKGRSHGTVDRRSNVDSRALAGRGVNRFYFNAGERGTRRISRHLMRDTSQERQTAGQGRNLARAAVQGDHDRRPAVE